jgi:hypothetical protein
MSLVFISTKQESALMRFKRRVNALYKEPYTAKVRFFPARRDIDIPGQVTLLAANSGVYSRLARMLKRIVPEAKISFEHGYGWNSFDRTPYHYGEISYLVKQI